MNEQPTVAPGTFDRLVDVLGAELAAEALRAAWEYVAEHRDCQLAGITIVDDGTDVAVQLEHAPGCPALTEGNDR